MAKKKANVDDIWANVPKDVEGHYLEAATDESGYVIASEKISNITSHPIKAGNKIGIRETVQLPLKGSYQLFASGPPGSKMTISLERVFGSGGHNHGAPTAGSFAVGTIFPDEIVFGGGWPQNVRTVYSAWDVSGAVRLIGRCSAPPYVIEHRMEIMIQGLQPIQTTLDLKLKPPTTIHPSPYWGAPSFISKLVQLSNLYAATTGKSITITDASLEWGGRFDLQSDWMYPHHEHMDGHQADIRSNDMTMAESEIFLKIAEQIGLDVIVESDHWHVRG